MMDKLHGDTTESGDVQNIEIELKKLLTVDDSKFDPLSIRSELIKENIIKDTDYAEPLIIISRLDGTRSAAYVSKSDSKKDLADITVANHDFTMRKIYKNIFVLGIGWMFFFMSFTSLRSIQSSINHSNSIGMISLACIYSGFVLACAFTSTIVQRLGPKWPLVGGLFCQIIFAVANVYPVYYTLIPASIIAGFTQTAMWTAVGSLTVQLAKMAASYKKENLNFYTTRFFGVFYLFTSFAPVLGSLMTSLVMNYVRNFDANTSNIVRVEFIGNVSVQNFTDAFDNMYNFISDDQCGVNFCHHEIQELSKIEISQFLRYVITGAYTGCMLMGLAVFVFLLDVPRKYLLEHKKMRIKRQLLSLFLMWKCPKLWMIAPVIFFCGLQGTFLSAEITKAYVSCLLGVKVVGYAMMCFGITAALSSYLTSMAEHHIGRTIILLTGAVLNCGCLLFMMFKQIGSADVVFIFAICGVWGVTEGIWATHLNSLIGMLFPSHTEAAFSNFQLVVALGMTMGYAYGSYLCMTDKIYITGTCCIVAASCILILHVYTKRQRK